VRVGLTIFGARDYSKKKYGKQARLYSKKRSAFFLIEYALAVSKHICDMTSIQ
jgi:hypothetical protein